MMKILFSIFAIFAFARNLRIILLAHITLATTVLKQELVISSPQNLASYIHHIYLNIFFAVQRKTLATKGKRKI